MRNSSEEYPRDKCINCHFCGAIYTSVSCLKNKKKSLCLCFVRLHRTSLKFAVSVYHLFYVKRHFAWHVSHMMNYGDLGLSNRLIRKHLIMLINITISVVF